MPYAKSDGRSSRRWKAVCSKMKLEREWVCWLCGQEIDRYAIPNTAGCWTADHVLSLDEHPEIDPCDERNLRPAHKGCNSAKGARSFNPKPKPPTGSRVW